MRFTFASHSGYRVTVLATGPTVELQASRQGRSGNWETATTYLARASLRGDKVRASFGHLGEISMRFVPAALAPSAKCERGRRWLIRHGLFVGSLRFGGEGGYLGVRVRRVKGMSIADSGLRCEAASGSPRDRSRGGRRRKLTLLGAGFRAGLDAVYFHAFKTGTGRAVYSVIDEAGGGRVAVFRHAYARSSPHTFATDDALSFASVSPSFPFSGTGLIRRRSDGSRSWSGSLTVSFPGDPRLQLTGPQFRTQLTRQW